MTIDTLHGPWAWAPKARYAQAARAGGLIFTGGIGPFGDQGKLIAPFGAGLANTASRNVYVSDMDVYREFEAVRQEILTAPHPASTVVKAGLLPDGMRIEINAVARAEASRVEADMLADGPPGSQGE
ncbi:RidA family protein [Streptomyces griseorubiginosus]|uniref:RidA family protein n=1 Tax=Streptomyces griseorubiginosus TaxID=67304 RepID=UPI001AD75680|nr:RidA family protein [Streptomyces griseorubiginosus]MBO4254648.1 hypothetical protein [Streptomyces griseorubiginosus]